MKVGEEFDFYLVCPLLILSGKAQEVTADHARLHIYEGDGS